MSNKENEGKQILALIKGTTDPREFPALVAEVSQFKGLRETELTLESAEQTAQAVALLNRKPHLKYLQRLERLGWLAEMLTDQELPVLLKLKAMEMLQKSMGDYQQTVTLQQTASAVLVVHDNSRGGEDEKNSG